MSGTLGVPLYVICNLRNEMIHPTAIISEQANIDANVKIGPFTIIHDNVHIGNGTIIDGHCEIGYPTKLAKQHELHIGENSTIRSHSVIYTGSSFKKRLHTGHRVTIRENTFAGQDFNVGTLGDIQGDCLIGDYVRLHSNVHISKGSRIGDFVWIFPYVVLTNDPHPPSNTMDGVTIEDYAVIATNTTIMPGVVIGKNAVVGAHSCVNKNIKPDMLATGVPIKHLCKTSLVYLTDGTNRHAYPWRKHFSRGYPDEIIKRWSQEFKKT